MGGRPVTDVAHIFCEEENHYSSGCEDLADLPTAMPSRPSNAKFFHSVDEHLGCCANRTGSNEITSVESLSYQPLRFDDGPTTDTERSHERYNLYIGKRQINQPFRGPLTWMEWLRDAPAGRPMVLLTPQPEDTDKPISGSVKIRGWVHIDVALTQLTLFTYDSDSSHSLIVRIDSIKLVCPAAVLLDLFQHDTSSLEESELERAVLLQYIAENSHRKHVCFVMESSRVKTCFIQALTALLLEQRRDEDIWV